MDATLSASGTTPRAALALGYAGLVPFVAGAIAAWALGDEARPTAGFVLAGYAAVIVSFLGGIHWGIGFLRGDALRFVWGIVPSLVAWPALLMPPAAALALLAAMLVVCYVVDRRVYPACGLRHWLPLRLHLSTVAAACCAAGAIGVGR
jgi:hypothetical protein